MPNREQTTQETTKRNPDVQNLTPRKRGFGAMDPALVRELARKGGVAAHRVGTAHEFTSEEARAAGRKGGLASHSGRRQRAGERGPETS
jgi:general stress protein YciG